MGSAPERLDVVRPVGNLRVRRECFMISRWSSLGWLDLDSFSQEDLPRPLHATNRAWTGFKVFNCNL